MHRIRFRKVHLILLLIFLFPILNCTNIIYTTSIGNIIDHESVDIPLSDFDIAEAHSVKIYFEHASVGGNISGGLDALYGSDSRYSRSNFIFNNRGNPGNTAKIDDFYSRLISNTPGPSLYSALMFKFCYIDNTFGGAGSVDDMDVLFTHVQTHIEDLESRYPSNIFVWWTMPLETAGNANRDRYNLLVRNYCRDNNKILFDIADIESHDPAGNYHTDGGYEALYDSYSTDGGHLNDVVGVGANRVAKGFWYMAYRLKIIL